VALITGAARGIGQAYALALAHAGADIVLGLRNKATGVAVAQDIENLGRRVLPVQMDVTNREQIDNVVQAAMDTFGQIDNLVNNVGIGESNPAELVTEDDFDDTIAVNLKGTFFTTQAVSRTMLTPYTGFEGASKLFRSLLTKVGDYFIMWFILEGEVK
jgi:NAD(P)-dependent dehydrogenase (short-subunit alcohol dehydrogenase family)